MKNTNRRETLLIAAFSVVMLILLFLYIENLNLIIKFPLLLIALLFSAATTESKLIGLFFEILCFVLITFIIIFLLSVIISLITNRAKNKDINTDETKKSFFQFKYFFVVEVCLLSAILLAVPFFDTQEDILPLSDALDTVYESEDARVYIEICNENVPKFPVLEKTKYVEVHFQKRSELYSYTLTFYPSEYVRIDESDIRMESDNEGVTVYIQFSDSDIKAHKFYFDSFGGPES